MKSIIEQSTNICRIAINSGILDDDKNFLSQFYTFDETANWQLNLNNDVYELRNNTTKLSITLDFREGNYRHRNNNIGNEPLVKAIKIKGKLPSTLIDATPGVLKDSFMLAHRGIHITAIERQPLLYTMVKRALKHVNVGIDYYFGDAQELISDFLADVIYLDPMYPPKKKKSANVKKDMQILHDIVGTDSDASLLFAAAHKTSSRIVVKRPSYATPISEIVPTHSYAVDKRGATRFDIYV
ncbi:MAG: class I SAM-dependent methyltransferase [Gammaproteobacteria bacterium]|nr:class I SAM-dependent methyltransferase [Gammaproteobacteria bacterium]